MAEITVRLARAYFLDRVKELRQQEPHGNPFVFLCGFSLLSTLAKATGSYNFERLVNRVMGYPKQVSQTMVYTARDRFFERFTLVPEHPEYEFDCIETGKLLVEREEDKSAFSSVEKLNLSHKSEEHLQVNGNKVTLAAAPFIDDIERAINKVFDVVEASPLESAKMYVYFNSGNQLIGYGD